MPTPLLLTYDEAATELGGVSTRTVEREVAAGKLRVLNTWGAERLAKFPDAPTLKELGLDLVQNSPFGIGAPKGTPTAVVKRQIGRAHV